MNWRKRNGKNFDRVLCPTDARRYLATIYGPDSAPADKKLYNWIIPLL